MTITKIAEKSGKTWNFKPFLHVKKRKFDQVQKFNYKGTHFYILYIFLLKNTFKIALQYLCNVVILFKTVLLP